MTHSESGLGYEDAPSRDTTYVLTHLRGLLCGYGACCDPLSYETAVTVVERLEQKLLASGSLAETHYLIPFRVNFLGN